MAGMGGMTVEQLAGVYSSALPFEAGGDMPVIP